NRQGRSESDWYAGADIFIRKRHCSASSIGPLQVFPRPSLDNAWEILRAAFGDPLALLDICPRTELGKLGLAEHLTEFHEELVPFKIAVFKDYGSEKAECGSLIYCSDGLRNLGIQHSQLRGHTSGIGCELVFQLRSDKNSQSACQTLGSSAVPSWPSRALAMGWLLIQSSRSKLLEYGHGLSSGLALDGSDNFPVRSIFSLPFQRISLPQGCHGGEFCYVNLVGITNGEAELVSAQPLQSKITAQINFHIRRGTPGIRGNDLLHQPEVQRIDPAWHNRSLHTAE
ncbi:MAG: hypothetical protein DCC75_04850, partial [Proteobacteria bacterium]